MFQNINRREFIRLANVFFTFFMDLAKFIVYSTILRSILYVLSEVIYNPFGLCSYEASYIIEPLFIEKIFGVDTTVLYSTKRSQNLICNVLVDFSFSFRALSFNFNNVDVFTFFLSTCSFWLYVSFFTLIYSFIFYSLFILTFRFYTFIF